MEGIIRRQGIGREEPTVDTSDEAAVVPAGGWEILNLVEGNLGVDDEQAGTTDRVYSHPV
jgi:hypothetical protein